MNNHIIAEKLSDDDEIGSRLKEFLEEIDRFSIPGFINSICQKLETDLMSLSRDGFLNNLFQGATINNLTINNGSVTKSYDEHYYKSTDKIQNYSTYSDQAVETGVAKQKEVDWGLVGRAVNNCMPFFWGHAAFATIYCVCRDEYGFPGNASAFEQKMNEMNIECPKGTIANAFRNNPFMKKPINRWERDIATPRVFKLIEVFRECIKTSLDDNITT